MALPDPKLVQARRAAERGDWAACLRIVVSFGELGAHKERIHKGWNARLRPVFYSELGLNPDTLYYDAVVAVCERYSWEVPPADAVGD